MRKLLLPALLLISSISWGQSVTITGTLTDSSGNAANSGYVQFTVSPQNASILYTIIGTSTLAPGTSKCSINPSGIVFNQTLTGPCLVWGNDVITPANTLYTVAFFPNGSRTNLINNVLLTGSSANLSSLTLVKPQPVIGTFLNANPITTMGFQPNQTNIFNIGNLNYRYASVYANGINILQYIDILPSTTPANPTTGCRSYFNPTTGFVTFINSTGGNCGPGGGGGGGGGLWNQNGSPNGNLAITTSTFLSQFTVGDFGVSPMNGVWNWTDTSTTSTDTSTNALFDTGVGSRHNPFTVRTNGINQFQVCWSPGPQSMNVTGSALSCSSLSTSPFSKTWLMSVTGAHAVQTMLQTSVTSTATMLRLHNATAAGGSYDFLTACSSASAADGSCSSGNNQARLHSDGSLFLNGSLSVGTGTGPTYSSSAGVPSRPCGIGDLDTNTAAVSLATVLYVCYPINTWNAVTIP